MKRLAMMVLAMLLLAPCAQAAEMENSNLRIELGPLFMWRLNAASYPLLVDENTLATDFETSELDEGTLFGLQGEVEWAITKQWALQVAAFWTGFSTHKVTNNDVGDFDNATYDEYLGDDLDTTNSSALDVFEAEIGSQLIGAEVNVLTNYGLDLDWFRYYLGFRYIHYTEHLNTVSYDEYDDYYGLDGDIDRTFIWTSNNMFGGQVGIDLEYEVMDGLTLATDAWFAMFLNSVSMHRQFTADNGNDYREQDESQSFFAYGLGVSPEVIYMPFENVAFTIGGEFMWLQGVSEAGKYYLTISDSQNDSVYAENGVIFLGVNLGIVIMF